jgi:hypothetical protein
MSLLFFQFLSIETVEEPCEPVSGSTLQRDKRSCCNHESKRQKTGYGLYWRRYTDNAGTGAAESPSGCTDGEFLLRESCRIYD